MSMDINCIATTKVISKDKELEFLLVEMIIYNKPEYNKVYIFRVNKPFDYNSIDIDFTLIAKMKKYNTDNRLDEYKTIANINKNVQSIFYGTLIMVDFYKKNRRYKYTELLANSMLYYCREAYKMIIENEENKCIN